MPLSHTDVRRILEILDQAEHLESLEVKLGDFVLRARKPGALPSAGELAPRTALTQVAGLAPAVAAAPQSNLAATSAPLAALLDEEVPDGMVAVRSPMVGTFYTRPSPDQPPFVCVGSPVQIGDTVCLVEVMKMFNSLKASVAGTVRRILVDNGKPVQHDQILLLIEPAKES